MTDSKISKKKHPTGSLARRILTISILLLVIPLFLHSFFLYRQEYKQALAEWTEDLDVVAKERAHLIKETIQLNWALLDVLSANTSDNPQANPSGPFHVEKIPFPQGVPDKFVLLSKSRNAIIVGKKHCKTMALIIPIPFSGIGKEIPFAHPVRISLIDGKGKVFWESLKFKEGAEVLQVVESIPNTEFSLQLSMDTQSIQALHLDTYYFRFVSLLFFVGGLGGLAVYLFTRRISRPLKDLGRTMIRVSEGSSHMRYTPDAMGFEINELGLQFNETMDALLQQREEVEKQRLMREKLAEELRIGHEIQSNLSPTHIPGLPGVDIATGYFAAKEVNGDFYDLYRLEDGRLLLAVCDTAGKGISACLFSLGLRSMIRALASVTTDLADIVRRANDLYYMDAHESSMFSTLWIGIYNPKNHHLIYCSQGHPAALLKRDHEIKELWTDGIALGAQKTDMIPTKEISLQKGDFLLLYTDGILEAHNVDNGLFGKHRLHEFILQRKNETSQRIADELIDQVRLFSQGALQHDDMTLIAMRISD